MTSWLVASCAASGIWSDSYRPKGAGGSLTFIHQLKDNVLVAFVSLSQFRPEIGAMVTRYIDRRIEEGYLGLSDDRTVPAGIIMLTPELVFGLPTSLQPACSSRSEHRQAPPGHVAMRWQSGRD
jgi:hypothetical protein